MAKIDFNSMNVMIPLVLHFILIVRDIRIYCWIISIMHFFGIYK